MVQETLANEHADPPTSPVMTSRDGEAEADREPSRAPKTVHDVRVNLGFAARRSSEDGKRRGRFPLNPFS